MKCSPFALYWSVFRYKIASAQMSGEKILRFCEKCYSSDHCASKSQISGNYIVHKTYLIVRFQFYIGFLGRSSPQYLERILFTGPVFGFVKQSIGKQVFAAF
uniref:Uncharacterized protein n=1 Tax=Schistocephalus solidus TaxID=70667 RepID=A0A0X3PGQ3_SCHSO